MKIVFIVAYSLNRAIGKNNKLLWHLADDMVFFKKMTSGKTVLMGKNTYLSLPAKFRPLPNRINLVISSNDPIEEKDNLEWFTSIENALYYCRKKNIQEILVIGGGQIYKSLMDRADTVFATEVNANIKGDAFMPKMNEKEWRKTVLETHQRSEKNDYDYEIIEYNRI